MTICLITLLSLGLGAQTAFRFDGQEVVPGTKRHFSITLSDASSYETIIPITIFHGTEDGPVLGITAGVHGYEYAPILAGQELIGRIDPGQLNGTVILVQIANVGSFLGRSPYRSPADQKNLNRAFPGNANGTITDRLAAYLSKEVIGRCDYFLDMHSGDAPEDLMSYCAYYHHDDWPDLSEQSKQMALHMGFDHVVIFNTTEQDYIKEGSPSLYCSAEAYKQGIPSVDIECGRLGLVEVQYVDQIVTAVESVLCHLKITPGQPVVMDQVALVSERTSMSSLHDGFFYPLKASGDYVLQGMKLGYITNFFNETIAEVHAERSGTIMYILGTPPVNRGETIASIGSIQK
ncbi:MAG: M14 family metallopeptidase [Bacteroidota bacterium]